MASVNKVIIVGNLGADPEIRYLPSGAAIATLSVATSYQSTDRHTGHKTEHTEWHRITLFDQRAEVAGRYLKKGRSVYVEGRLQTRKYTDKDGIERYVTDIIGHELQMLGARPTSDAPAPAPAAAPAPGKRPAPAQQRAPGPAPSFADMDDDIPF